MTTPKKRPRTKEAKVTYRRFIPTFWTDRDVNGKLDAVGICVLSYTFTNEHAHPCGVYRLRPAWVEDELPKEVTFERFLELVRGPLSQFVTYSERNEEIFVHAMAEHQIEGGLHGKDLRIPWVEKQVASIRSDELRAAFAERYSHWNLERSRMDVPDVDNPTAGATESAADTPKAGTPAHGGNGAPEPKTKGHPEAPSERGITKGHEVRGIAKPAAAAATAAAPRTTTSTPSLPLVSHGDDDESSDDRGREGGRSRSRVNGEPQSRTVRILAAEPLARIGLNRMRGRDDEGDVTVLDHAIGYGLDVTRWRAWAHLRPEDPDLLARALWFIRDVLETPIDGPITMALVESMPALQEQAIHRALKEAPTRIEMPDVLKGITAKVESDFEDRRASAKASLDLLIRQGEQNQL